MEDLLTSNTFGLMNYWPVSSVLLPFLGRAVNPLTRTYLAKLLSGMDRAESWRFWPTLSHSDCISCEPDVEVIFSDGGRNRVGILIEAKYRSGKSSFAQVDQVAPCDQLARELDNLRAMARSKGLTAFAVVYVTAAISCPIDDIQDSADEYRAKRNEEAAIYWLSWRNLPELLSDVAKPFDSMASDLRKLLVDLGLTPFNRLRFEGVITPPWSFQHRIQQLVVSPLLAWQWSLKPPKWRFEQVGGTTDSFGFAIAILQPNLFYSWERSS